MLSLKNFFVTPLPPFIGNLKRHRAGCDATICGLIYSSLLHHAGALVIDCGEDTEPYDSGVVCVSEKTVAGAPVNPKTARMQWELSCAKTLPLPCGREDVHNVDWDNGKWIHHDREHFKFSRSKISFALGRDCMFTPKTKNCVFWHVFNVKIRKTIFEIVKKNIKNQSWNSLTTISMKHRFA